MMEDEAAVLEAVEDHQVVELQEVVALAVVVAAHRSSSKPWNRRGPEIFRE